VVLRDPNKAKPLRHPDGQYHRVATDVAQDIMPIDEPPLSPEVLRHHENIRQDFNNSQKKKGLPEIAEYDPDVRKRGADAAIGLSASAAEQVIALNTTGDGLNIPGVWGVKIDKIGQIKGVSIHRGDERIEDYVGYEYAVRTMLKMVTSKRMGIRGVWLWDEIEKDFAGTWDNNGVPRNCTLRSSRTSRTGGPCCSSLGSGDRQDQLGSFATRHQAARSQW
jgi:hypothetical protein